MIRLYQTVIVKYNQNLIHLNNGGWNTPTTVKHMNRISTESKLGYTVFIRKGQMFVKHNGITLPFDSDNRIILINP